MKNSNGAPHSESNPVTLQSWMVSQQGLEMHHQSACASSSFLSMESGQMSIRQTRVHHPVLLILGSLPASPTTRLSKIQLLQVLDQHCDSICSVCGNAAIEDGEKQNFAHVIAAASVEN